MNHHLIAEHRAALDEIIARLLKADPEVSAKLKPTEIDAMFDDFYHLKHVDAIFERVFGADSKAAAAQ